MSELNHSTQSKSIDSCQEHDSSPVTPHGIPQLDLEIPLEHCLTLSHLLFVLSDSTTRHEDKNFCVLYARYFELHVRHWLSATHLARSSSASFQEYLIDLRRHHDRSEPGPIVGEK